MLVTLIPLFLAANLAVRENENGIKEKWMYGPEVIYDVKVETVSHSIEDTNAKTHFNMTMKLSCREKFHSTLSCQFHDANLTISDERKNKKTMDTERINPAYKTFEMNFDREGMRNIIVPASLDAVTLDTMKAIVAQMNIGAAIFHRDTDNFVTWENFTTGTCKTNYALSSRNSSDNDIGTMMNPHEILIFPTTKIIKSEIMEITRMRNLNECIDRVDYFLGSREAHESTLNLDVKIKSSESHTLIGEREFVSWTENTILVSNEDNSNGHKLTEKITLSLDDIVPADGPLETFDGPTLAAGIFPEDNNVESSEEKIYSSEESNSEESKESSEEMKN